MWIVDRTGGECSKTVFRHKHAGAVFTAPQIGSSFTPWCTPHADLAPRHPAAAPHTRATERRAGHHTREPPSAALSGRSTVGATGRCSPSRFSARVGCGLTSAIRPRFHVSGTELYRRCTARYVGYSLYRARRRSELYRGRAEPQRTLSGTGRQCVRSETIHIGSLHITAVSVTCVRWTARV